MERLNPKVLILTSLILIAVVVGSYAIGIGIIGKGSFSFESSSWEGFAGYLNNHLHKEKIDLSKLDFPRNEWAHFSQSLIQEQDKRMKYCYEYCLWLLEEPSNKIEQHEKELLIYRQFYENLISDGTLNEP